MEFNEFKSEILHRASSVNACKSEYERARNSETFAELFTVIKDNFYYCCDNNIIDVELLERVKDIASDNRVHCNESIDSGYLLTYGSVTVWASGSVTVWASGSVTVEASGSATVRAYGSATVRASGSATIRAYDSVTVRAYDSVTVWASDSVTVEAYGSAYINVISTMECKILDRAIMRYRDTNEVFTTESLKHRLWKENK